MCVPLDAHSTRGEARGEESMNRLPGVKGSGLALYNPLTDNWGELILVSGHPAPKLNEEAGASWDRVSADYLQNFGVTILRGRYFTTADNETTAAVAIVNEAFVKRFFKSDEDALGQHFAAAKVLHVQGELPKPGNVSRVS